MDAGDGRADMEVLDDVMDMRDALLGESAKYVTQIQIQCLVFNPAFQTCSKLGMWD